MIHDSLIVTNYSRQRFCDLLDNTDLKARNIDLSQKINEISELRFNVPITNPKCKYLKNENLVLFNNEYYIIKNPTIAYSQDGTKVFQVTCKHMSSILASNLVYIEEIVPRDLETLMKIALCYDDQGRPTLGWSVGRINIAGAKKLRGLEASEESPFSTLVRIAEKYEAVLEFDSINMKVNVNSAVQENPVLDLRVSQNVKEFEVSVDTSELVTRLYCYGAEDDSGNKIDIMSVNPTGMAYIDNFSYFKELGYTDEEIKNNPSFFVRPNIWEDGNYVDAQELYEQGLLESKKSASAKVKVNVTGIDVHSQFGKKLIELKNGQCVNVIDDTTGISYLCNVTSRSINYDDFWTITVGVANAVDYRNVLNEIYKNVNMFSKMTTSDNKISGSHITTIDASQITNLVVGDVTTEYLEANYASIKYLETKYLTSEQIKTTYLIASEADLKYASIGDLQATNANIQKLTADKANITDLEAINAKIGELVAGSITTDYLESNYAKIDLANIKDGCITTAMIGEGVIGNVQIADGSITDAKIVGLTANKITAGKLDAAEIEVINLNCANLTVGTINGQQIAPGAIDLSKLDQALSGTITTTSEEVKQALIDAGLAQDTADGAQADATKALEDALKAYQEAQAAKLAAGSAQTSADGKNSVYYKPTPPTGTFKVGDTWYNTSQNNKMSYWDGVQWKEYKFGSEALEDDAVTADKIAQDVNQKIADAFANAGTAMSEAQTAKQDASSAKTDASTAKQEASNAKTEANSAKTKAEQASKDATSAKTDASSAKTTADAAKQLADTAKSISDAAKKAAEDAAKDLTALDGKLTTVESTVTNNTSKLTTQGGKISALESVTTETNKQVTAVKGEMTTAKQNITTLQTNYSSLDSSLKGLTVTVGQHTSSINTVTKTVTDNKSNWDKAATALTTATDAKNKIDNLEIGARNLLRDSGCWTSMPNSSYWWGNGGASISLDNNNKYQGYSTLKSTVGNGVSGTWYTLEVGKTYTYAAMIKSDVTFTGSVATPLHYWVSTDKSASNSTIQTVYYMQSITVANKWTLLYVTFKPNAQYFKPYVYFGTSKNCVMNIAYLTLCEGSKPLQSWSPAPEDIDTRITSEIKTVTDKQATFQTTLDGITGRVSSVETTTTTVKNTVDANKTNWDKAVTALNTANTAKSTAESAASTATTAKTTADQAKTEASSAKSTASTAATTANTAKTTADTAKSTADSAKSTATTASTNASNALTTANDAKSKIDGLQIGGRNYIILSKLSAYGSYNTVPTYSGDIITTKWVSSYTGNTLTLSINGFTPKAGVYTLSGYLKVNGKVPTSKYFTGLASTYGGTLTASTYDTTTGYFVITQRYPGNSVWIIHAPTTRASGSTDTVTLEKLMFEEGNKATSHTVAPEDIDNRITTEIKTVTDKQSALELTVNQFKTTVSSTYATKTQLNTVDGKFASYSTTTQMNSAITAKANEINLAVSKTYATQASVSTVDGKFANYSTTTQMNSAITAKANEITLSVEKKVDKTSIIAAINLTSEAVKISASKIDLSGYVTITNIGTAGKTVIDGGNVKTGTITATQIASNAITAVKIAGRTITADKLVAKTLTAASGVFADACIVTANIANLAVTSAKIANLAVGNAQIANAAITTAKIANLSITNALIANGAIDNAKIANLDAGKITTGTISADRIAAGSIVLGKLDSTTQGIVNVSKTQQNNYGYRYAYDIIIKGDSKKYYPVIFRAGNQYAMREIFVSRGYSEQAPSDWYNATHHGALTLKIKCNFGGWGGANYSWYIHDFEEVYTTMFAGAQHVMDWMGFAVFLRGGGTTGAIYHIYSDQGINVTSMGYTSPQICYNSEQIGYSIGNGTAAAPQYKWNAPAPRTAPNTSEINPRVYTKVAQSLDSTIATWCYNNDRTYINGGKLYTGTVTATQIAANAIVAGKIATNAVTAGTIVAGAISADKLAANAVTAGKIAANAVTTATIAAGAVNADKISSNAILAKHISAGVITGDKLVAATITGAKIAARTIAANNIVAGAITAAEIKSGTITATQIASGTITATQLASNSVTAVKIAASAITTDKLGAGAVTAAKIAAGTITAAQIAAKAITADKLNVTSLSAITANIGAVTSGSLNIGGGKFVVTSAGAMTATSASITGTINATGGRIGVWKIENGVLYGEASISESGKIDYTTYLRPNYLSLFRAGDSSLSMAAEEFSMEAVADDRIKTRITKDGVYTNGIVSTTNLDTVSATIRSTLNAKTIQQGGVALNTLIANSVNAQPQLVSVSGWDEGWKFPSGLMIIRYWSYATPSWGAWGNVYDYTLPGSKRAVPAGTFISNPCWIACNSSYGNGIGWMPEYVGSGSVTKCPEICAVRATTYVNTIDYCIIGIGRWK